MTTDAINVQNLVHRYQRAGSAGADTVLDGVDLTVRRGQTLALVGASGSGKSTLLNLISGLEPIQQGSISVLGEPLRSMTDAQRTRLRRTALGFIYQSFNLIPTLTVFENIALPLTLNRSSREQCRQRVAFLQQQLNLDGKERQFPDQLSGGEQQRVAVARALAHEPELLLADEPTGNLDAANGAQVLECLLSLCDAAAVTLVLVTHSREVAARASETWVLQQGKLHPGGLDTTW